MVSKKKTMTDAYFSSTFLDSLEPFDREILSIASIAYDVIYVDKDVKNLSWEMATSYRNYFDKRKSSAKHETTQTSSSLPGAAFANIALLNSIMLITYLNSKKELSEPTKDKTVSGNKTSKVGDFPDAHITLEPTPVIPSAKPPMLGPTFMGTMYGATANELENLHNHASISDISNNALTAYLDWDINACNEFLDNSKLRYIREIDNDEIREFFYLNFEQAMKTGKTSPIFHTELFDLLINYYSILSGSDIRQDFFTKSHLIIMVQEFFTAYFLSAKYGISPILTTSEIELRLVIESLPPIPMQPASLARPILFRKYCDLAMIQDMLDFKNAQHDEIQPIIELSVPRFSEIPLVEIAKLKKKDKFSSIAKLSEKMRQNKKITDLDFSKIFVDELWEMGKTLSPSVKENIIGVLGELPLPIPINPISILSSANSIKNLVNFKKEYSWFIVLSQLKDLSSKKTRN